MDFFPTVVMLQNIPHCCPQYNPTYVFTQSARVLMPDRNHLWCSSTVSPKASMRILTKILPVFAGLIRSDVLTDGRTVMAQLLAAFSRIDLYWKTRARKQRTDMRKYSFVNRSITDWNRLPEDTIETSQGKTRIFKTRIT